MRAPVVPGVPSLELVVTVRDACALKLIMETTVGFDQTVIRATIKAEGWQAMGVVLEAGDGLQGLILGQIEWALSFEDEGLQIGGVGHAAVGRESGIALCMKRADTKRAITAHGEPAEELRCK